MTEYSEDNRKRRCLTQNMEVDSFTKTEGELLHTQEHDLYSLISSLRQEMYQDRHHNQLLFRATSNELKGLQMENNNLTNLVLKLRTEASVMEIKLDDCKQKIRDLEITKMFNDDGNLPNEEPEEPEERSICKGQNSQKKEKLKTTGKNTRKYKIKSKTKTEQDQWKRKVGQGQLKAKANQGQLKTKTNQDHSETKGNQDQLQVKAKQDQTNHIPAETTQPKQKRRTYTNPIVFIHKKREYHIS